jgi:hypothetical protein
VETGGMDAPTRYPVFIVGSPRSGTSILIDAVRGAGYRGFNEGNFLTGLRGIQIVIDRLFQTFDAGNQNVLISRVNRAALKASLYRVVAEAAEAQYEGRPWVDKTGNPEMIEAIPILLYVWPASHFIFARRRAIENVFSRLRKFPQYTFEYHCADWARNMAAWRRMREQVPNLRAIEVDQFEIGRAPAETAARIAQFLGLTEEAAARIAGIFMSERPQQTEAGSAERVLTLETTGWSEQQLQVFRTQCSAEMSAFGYTIDERYREAPSPAPSAPA